MRKCNSITWKRRKMERKKQSTMSRGREAWQQLAASYYAFDGFPELMFVFFFCGPFSEARLTPSILWSLHQKQPGSRARSLHFPLVFLPEKRTEKAPPLPRSSAIAGALCGRDRKECRKGPRQIRTPGNVSTRALRFDKNMEQKCLRNPNRTAEEVCQHT